MGLFDKICITCEGCSKTSKVKNLEDIEKQGWLKVSRTGGYDYYLCPQCKEKH